jgi:hypothetical protein
VSGETPVDEPEEKNRQRNDDEQEQSGEKPDLLLVRRKISFAPLICPAKHRFILLPAGISCKMFFYFPNSHASSGATASTGK